MRLGASGHEISIVVGSDQIKAVVKEIGGEADGVAGGS
jgi:hypothetical protein